MVLPEGEERFRIFLLVSIQYTNVMYGWTLHHGTGFIMHSVV